MPLPAGYDVTDFIPDPHRRANHAYCPDTDETFHLGEADYALIVAAQPDVPKVAKIARAKRGAAQEVQAVEPAATPPANPDAEVRTTSELHTMAADLGIEHPEKSTDEELMALITDAIAGDKTTDASK